MILFGDLHDGGRVEVTVKDDKLEIAYNKPIVLEQFKPKVEDAKNAQ